MDKNRVAVVINGNEYILKGDEREEEMLKVAAYVDNEIKKVMSHNNRLNPTFASVLAALNITNSYFKLDKEFSEYKVSAQELIRQLNDMKTEYNSLLKDNIKLQENLGSTSREADKNDEELKSIKDQYEELYSEYINKNDELSKFQKEYEILKREKENKQKELERVKMELSESKYKLIDLQNQLLQNQIDLVKVKKEFDEFKSNYNRESGENDV